MSGNLATRISISADDKATAVFRKVGDEADRAAARLLGVGASASNALRTAGIDFGGSQLGNFVQKMSTLTTQVSMLGRETGGTFGELKKQLQENIKLMGLDTQAYIANTQAAIANAQARLDYLDKGITANKEFIARTQKSNPDWKYRIDGLREEITDTIAENNRYIAEQNTLTSQLEQHQRNLAAATAYGTGRMSGFSRALGTVKTGAVSLINFMGGPWVIGIGAAVAAVGYLATADSKAEKAAKSYGLSLEDIDKRYKDIVSGADAAAAATLRGSDAFTQAHSLWLRGQQERIDAARAEAQRLTYYASFSFFDPDTNSEIKTFYDVPEEYLDRLRDINAELQKGGAGAQEAELRLQTLRAEVEKQGGMSSFSKLLKEMGTHFAFVAQNAQSVADELDKAGWDKTFLDAKGAKELNSAMDETLHKLAQLGRAKPEEALFDFIHKSGFDASKLSVTGGVVSAVGSAATQEQVALYQRFLDLQKELFDAQEKQRKSSAAIAPELRERKKALESYNDELASYNDTLARLTMGEEAYKEFKFDQKIEEYKRLGLSIEQITNLTRAWNEAQAAERGHKSAEQEKKLRQDNLDILQDFEKDYLQLVRGTEAAQAASIKERGALYAQAGADMVRLAEWQAEMELKHSRSAAAGMKLAFKDYADDATNRAKNAGQFIGTAFSSLEDTWAQFCTNGKFEFSSFANSVIADLGRIAIRQSITGPLASALSGAIGGLFSGGGSAAGGLAASSASASYSGISFSAEQLFASRPYHHGGIIGEGGAARSVPASLFASAPRYHTGGLAGDEVPAILRRDEGVFTPGQMARLAPVESLAGLGRLQVYIHISNDSSAQVEAGVTQEPSGSLPIDLFIDEVDKQLARRISSGQSQTGMALDRSRNLNRAHSLYRR